MQQNEKSPIRTRPMVIFQLNDVHGILENRRISNGVIRAIIIRTNVGIDQR
jgi:hypothetical protein